MPGASLTISIPEGAWIHDVSTASPETTFRVVAVLSSGGSGVALLELRTDDPVPVIAAVERRDDVTAFDLLWKHEDATLVQVETTDPVLVGPLLRAGIPLRTPFDVVDGEATWEVTTSTERLSALGARLDAAGITYDLESVYEEPPDPADRLLTDRQRDLLLRAASMGYYDTPRRATLTEVSAAAGVSKATGSDVLHRAEGAVLSWFIDEHLAAGRERLDR